MDRHLTERQYKTRWTDIKKQIKERPLLAYRVGIPLDKWDHYMHSIPSKDEIDRVYLAIQDDRRLKTQRIKEALSQIVGYREVKLFSRKSGVSDCSIKNIIEGKKDMAGYDVINRLELFLSRIMPDFELSIENTLTIKNYTSDYIGDITKQIDIIADRLKRYCFTLIQQARKKEPEIDFTGNPVSPTQRLENNINELIELKEQIDTFWKVYIDGDICK